MNQSVAATFVFTDLVGSTALSSSLDVAKAEALRQQHFAVLRAAIEATGGREVKNLGDGLMVVFLSPSRALACAVSMQQGIERRNRRADPGLSIRIGVSLGEAVEEDGDFFGDPVVEAARLCAYADGGQVLASELVRMAVGRHGAHEFTSIGALDLKGLPGPVSAVQVRWEPADDEAEAGAVPLPPRLAAVASGGFFGFCGRTPEIAALGDAHKRAASERHIEIVLVAGEPGVGKTTLAASVARHAHAEGATVLLGECAEGSNVPYLPWMAALSHLVRHMTPEVLHDLKPVHAAALCRLLPADVDRIPSGETVRSDPETERFLLMESVVQLLELTSSRGPLLIVLDDLHWVDAASLALLRHLVASQVALPCLVVGTYRQSDLFSGHPLTAFLADLHRTASVLRVDLGGLAEAEIVELIELAAGYVLDEAGIELARALRRETDGNPFFVGELLRHLGESGAIAMDERGRYGLQGELEDITLPQSVREVVVQRVVRLGEDTRRMLSAASVLGREFELDVLEDVAEMSGDRLLDLLDAATNAALVTESEDPNRYRFTHGLIQSALYAELSVARRQRLHLRVAEKLEQSLEDEAATAAVLSELAKHWQAATKPANAEKAIEYARRAGDAAMSGLAPDDAAHFYAQALDLVERDPAPDQRQLFDILLALGTAQLVTDQTTARRTLKRAGAIAEALGDLDLLVAWASARLFGQSASDSADVEILRRLERTLELISDDDQVHRAQVLAAIVDETDPTNWISRLELCDAAVAAAEAAGDDRVMLDVFLATVFMTSADRAHDYASRAQRALEAAERSRDPVSIANVLGRCSEASLIRGEAEEARRAVDRLEELASTYGVPVMIGNAATYRVGICMLDGDLVALEEEAGRLLDMGLRGFPGCLAGYGGALFELQWAQGRLHEFAELFRDAPVTSYAGYRPALVLSSLAADDLERARAIFDGDAAGGFSSFPRDTVWLPCMSLFAEASIIMEDRVAAGQLYELLEPSAALHCFTGPIYYGVVARALGRLAAFLGRPAEGEHHLRWALDEHQRVGAKYWAAKTAADLAALLVSTGSATSSREAAQLLEDVVPAAEASGYTAVLEQIEAILPR